ncbi:MAG TPA: PQQ-binding-like beta-propeller repeat protein [Pirellulales bacterium]|jgi:outer membrane protein assembly factor BamB
MRLRFDFHCRHIAQIALVVPMLCVALTASLRGEDWPQFRGPDGQGYSRERDLPLEWSESENVVWKTPLPGLGWSSPVVRGRLIWLTTAIEQEGSLRALCIDALTGQVLRDVEVFHKADLGPINPKNSHASPTPVIDGDRVFVHFGAHGTACLSLRGDVLWRNDQLAYDHRHGPGGSPVVWRDLLIFHCDGADTQAVVALDRQTGRVRWRTDRQSQQPGYGTPLLTTVNGADQLISPGGGMIASYEPATGREIWRLRHGGDSVVLRPVVDHGLVYVSSGYTSTALYAIDLASRGEISTADATWTVRRGVPFDPSPLIVGDELYLVSDQGVVTCLDARSGKQHWQSRLRGAFSASPLAADGRIYITSEEGVTTVIAPGKAMKKLAENTLDGRMLASLATADGAIFARTESALYRIQSSGGPAAQHQPVAVRKKPAAASMPVAR